MSIYNVVCLYVHIRILNPVDLKKNVILASSLFSTPLINVVSAGVLLYPQIAQPLIDASIGLGFIHDGFS